MIDVIVSKDTFLINGKINQLIKVEKETFSTEEVVTFDMIERGFSFNNVLEAIQTVSLFDTRKIVVLTTREKEMKNEVEESLLEIAKKIPDTVLFIVVLEKKLLAKSSLKKFFDKNARNHSISSTDDTIRTYVRQELKRRNISMSQAVMNAFLERTDTDLIKITSELDKFEVLDREISQNDVEKLVARNIDDNIFSLSDAIVKKNIDLVFSLYQDFLDIKIDPLALIGLIASSLRRMYQVNALLEANYSSTMIAEHLNMSEKQAYYLIRNQQENPNKILMLLNELGELDQRVKLGLVDRFIAFELFLINVTQ